VGVQRGLCGGEAFSYRCGEVGCALHSAPGARVG
jgi:hypothetical protein